MSYLRCLYLVVCRGIKHVLTIWGTWRKSFENQELFTIHDHLGLPPVFVVVFFYFYFFVCLFWFLVFKFSSSLCFIWECVCEGGFLVDNCFLSCFVSFFLFCLRLVSCVSIVSSVSGLTIFIVLSVFSNIYFENNVICNWIISQAHIQWGSGGSIRRGFAPCFANYKKGAVDTQPQLIKITSCLPMVGDALRVIRLLPPLKLVAMI